MSNWLTPENVKAVFDILIFVGIGAGGSVGIPKALQRIKAQKEWALTSLPPAVMKPLNGGAPISKADSEIKCLKNMEHCRSEVFGKFSNIEKEYAASSAATTAGIAALCGQFNSIDAKVDRLIERGH